MHAHVSSMFHRGDVWVVVRKKLSVWFQKWESRGGAGRMKPLVVSSAHLGVLGGFDSFTAEGGDSPLPVAEPAEAEPAEAEPAEAEPVEGSVGFDTLSQRTVGARRDAPTGCGDMVGVHGQGASRCAPTDGVVGHTTPSHPSAPSAFSAFFVATHAPTPAPGLSLLPGTTARAVRVATYSHGAPDHSAWSHHQSRQVPLSPCGAGRSGYPRGRCCAR